jgi:hypothetical protein
MEQGRVDITGALGKHPRERQRSVLLCGTVWWTCCEGVVGARTASCPCKPSVALGLRTARQGPCAAGDVRTEFFADLHKGGYSREAHSEFRGLIHPEMYLRRFLEKFLPL